MNQFMLFHVSDDDHKEYYFVTSKINNLRSNSNKYYDYVINESDGKTRQFTPIDFIEAAEDKEFMVILKKANFTSWYIWSVEEEMIGNDEQCRYIALSLLANKVNIMDQRTTQWFNKGVSLYENEYKDVISIAINKLTKSLKDNPIICQSQIHTVCDLSEFSVECLLIKHKLKHDFCVLNHERNIVTSFNLNINVSKDGSDEKLIDQFVFQIMSKIKRHNETKSIYISAYKQLFKNVMRNIHETLGQKTVNDYMLQVYAALDTLSKIDMLNDIRTSELVKHLAICLIRADYENLKIEDLMFTLG